MVLSEMAAVTTPWCLCHPGREEWEHKQAVGLASSVANISNELGSFEQMSFVINCLCFLTYEKRGL